MQEITFRSNSNSKNVTSYTTFRGNTFLAPQVESYLIDQASELCNAAGKTLAKTGGRYGKFFKAAGSLAKITGTGGKIALQSASKVSKLPIAPAATLLSHLNQIEKPHNPSVITHAVTLVKDMIGTAASLCLQATKSLFDILFTAEAEQDLIQGDDVCYTVHDPLSSEDEAIETAGNMDVEKFFDMYSL